MYVGVCVHVGPLDRKTWRRGRPWVDEIRLHCLGIFTWGNASCCDCGGGGSDRGGDSDNDVVDDDEDDDGGGDDGGGGDAGGGGDDGMMALFIVAGLCVVICWLPELKLCSTNVRSEGCHMTEEP